MPNLQKNGVGALLWIGHDATLTSHGAMVRICAFQIDAPFALCLIGEQLRVHQGCVDPHLPTRCAVPCCSSQQCFQVGGRSDEREEITTNNHQTRCGRFATPGSPISTDPCSGRSPFSGKGECGHIKINPDQLPFGGVEGSQDAPCAAPDLKNGAVRFRGHPPPIR